MAEKKTPEFQSGEKVTVNAAGMKNLVGPYKNTGTVSGTNGGRVLVVHDSTDKDMLPENMNRWHKATDLTKTK